MTDATPKLPEMPPPELTAEVPQGGYSELVLGWTEEALRAYATQAVLADRQRILSSDVVQFLFGASDLDGANYGEIPTGKPRYWWRSILRSAIRNG